MHRLLVFSVLDDSVVVLALEALEAWLPRRVAKAAENVLDLLLEEVVRTGLVITHVEVVGELGGLALGEAQLGQVVPAVVAEVKHGTRRKLVKNLASYGLMVLGCDRGQHEDQLGEVGRQWRKWNLLLH